MIIEKIQKINRLKNFLDHPDVTFVHSFKLSQEDLLSLARAKECIKNKKWVEGCELLLELIIKNIPHVPVYLFKELLNILFKLKDYDYDLTLKISLYLFEIEQGFDQKTLLSLMYEYQKHKQPIEAIKIYHDYFRRYIQQIPNDEVELMLAKAYLDLRKTDEAEKIILKILEKNNYPKIDKNLSEYLVEVYLNLAKTYSLSRRFQEAEELFLELVEKKPEYQDAKFLLANYYFRRNNNSEAERIFRELIAENKFDFKYVKTYVNHLFQFKYRFEEAMFFANQFIAEVRNDESKTLEIYAMKMLMAWHQDNFHSGKLIFEELLQLHPNSVMVLEMLKSFADKHQENEYLQTLVSDGKKSVQQPHFIQIIGESVKKNWWVDLSKPKQDVLFGQEIELPLVVKNLFLELKDENSSGEEIYLVGGSVLALIKNIELSSQSDIDLIFITQKREIQNYIPSRYIENLYIRDARRLGGISVDLIRLSPEEVNSHNLLEKNACLRDFTICAIYCNEQGKLFDPTGRGLQDILFKRLDTILDPHQTLYADPVRILRAFKYIARGYAPSPDLEYALKNINIKTLGDNQHFNRALLKELHSIQNINFVSAMQKFGFLKHLNYLSIESEKKDIQVVCVEIIKKLYAYQLNHFNHFKAEVVSLNETIENSQNEMLETKIKHFEDELRMKVADKIELSAQINQTNLDLQKIFDDKNEVLGKLEQIKIQADLSKRQLEKLKKESLSVAEKQKKIALLKRELSRKKQSNFDLKQNILFLDIEIQESVQEKYEQLSQKYHQEKMVSFRPCQDLIQSNQSLQINRVSLIKKLTSIRKEVAKNHLILKEFGEQSILYHQVLEFLNQDSQDFLKTAEESALKDLATNVEKKKYYFESSYPLEQMVQVVSIPELRSYLHAQIVLKELKKPQNINPFKVCNHLKNFLNFATVENRISFQQVVDNLLSKYVIKDISKNPNELLQMANEAKALMHFEKAIYYYQEAIRVYAEQSPKAKKMYYDAYLALGELYLQHHDVLQLDGLMAKLKMIRPEPKLVSQKLEEFCQKIQIQFVQFSHITKREKTYFGFQDFWIATLPTLNRFAARGYTFNMDFTTRKKIYNDISKKTDYVEEYLLALMEYTNVLMQEQSNQLYKIQLQLIQNIYSESNIVKLLKDWALNWNIPSGLKNVFIEALQKNNVSILQGPSDTKNWFKNVQNNTPFHQLEQLLHMQLHTRHETFYCYLSLYNGLKHLENGQDMRAMNDLEFSCSNSVFHGTSLEYLKEVQDRFPEISWDSCSADDWYQLGQKAKSNQVVFDAQYFFNHALHVDPYHLDASLAILELYKEQKDYYSLKRFLGSIEKIINYWSQLHSQNQLTFPQRQAFNQWSEKVNESVLFVENIYKKQMDMYARSIYDYTNSFRQASKLFIYFENFDLLKEKYITRLCWTLYSLNDGDITNHIKLINEVIVLNSYKNNEYAFAHFELAAIHFRDRNLNAIYHLKEACEIWDGFRIVAYELLGLEQFFELNEELLKKLNCFNLYQKQMKKILQFNHNHEMYRNHFKYLIENRQIASISEEQLQSYLTMDGLNCKQKIEILLLLDRYEEAKYFVESNHWTDKNDENRLFLWPISMDSIQKFIEKAYIFYQKLLEQVNPSELKFNILRKLIKLATFLQKNDSLDNYYDLVFVDKSYASSDNYTQLVKDYIAHLVKHKKEIKLSKLVEEIYNQPNVFQPQLIYYLQMISNPPVGAQIIEKLSLFKKSDEKDSIDSFVHHP